MSPTIDWSIQVCTLTTWPWALMVPTSLCLLGSVNVTSVVLFFPFFVVALFACAAFTRAFDDESGSPMSMSSASARLVFPASFGPWTMVTPDGAGLNPLLQDPGLAFHPPILYLGYVGFSIVFSFAVAALVEGRVDAAWARWVRPWTLAAWAALTLGIALGSWWAYYILGWGGFWFWDPVENASLMPWLAGTALLHSAIVVEKRDALKSWTVLLAILAFSLSLLGTFLVRSGVLTSVHAFANDPTRGVFILIFLAVVVGTSLTLFAWRAPQVTLGGSMGLLSRESLLLSNSVILVVATAAVLLCDLGGASHTNRPNATTLANRAPSVTQVLRMRAHDQYALRRRHHTTTPVIAKASGNTSRKVNVIRYSSI